MRLFACIAAAYVAIGSAAIAFKGGQMPHFVDVGGGKTAVAYANGVVYATDPDCMSNLSQKCTLWRKDDGTIMQTGSIYVATVWVGMAIEVPASDRLTKLWHQAQAALQKAA